MITRKKILFSALFTFIVSISTGLLTACNKNGSNSSASSNGSVMVSLSENEVNMTLGSTQWLNAQYNALKDVVPVWSSDNETIVSVKDGKIKAEDIGLANITVTYGNNSATCAVNVDFGEYIPTLEFNDIASSSEQISLAQGEQLNLNANVLFNQILFNDASFNYQLSNPAIGIIENGVFTPTTIGETLLQINTTWKDETFVSLQKTLKIVVHSAKEVEVRVNGSAANDIQLDTVEKTEQAFDVAVYEDGEKLTNVQISVVGTSVHYDETQKMLIVEKAGNSDVAIEATLKNGEKYKKNVRVSVLRATIDVAEFLDNFSALDGDSVGTNITLSSIVSGNIIEAYDEDGNALKVSNNKIYGLQTLEHKKTETSITVCDDKYAYKINVGAYTKVLDEAEDFKVFNIGAAKSNNYEIAGYYILANNIDASKYVHPSHGYVSATIDGETKARNLDSYFDSKVAIPGFTGTFDGNGYTVDGITVGAYGIFGLTSNSVFSKVSFTNVKYANKGFYECIFSGNTGSSILGKARFKDIYIHVAEASRQGRNSVISSWIFQNTALENIIIDLSDVQATWAENDYEKTFYALAAEFPYYKDPAVANIYTSDLYIISKYPLARQWRNNAYEDAAYIDGKAVEATYKWDNAKRYTSIEKFLEDGNNFSGFSPKCWDTGNSGEFAVFESAKVYTASVAMNETPIDKGIVKKNEIASVGIKAQGIYYKPDAIEIVQGEDKVEINGTQLKAIKTTGADNVIVKVKCGIYTGYAEFAIIQDTIQSDIVLDNFSAVDGDTVGGIYTVADVVGDKTILKAYDQNMTELTVDGTKIYGLPTENSGKTKTYISLITEENAYEVEVNGYTLIIDEPSDLNYFKMTSADKDATGSYYTKNFNGYYILTNNIDYTGNTFVQTGDTADWKAMNKSVGLTGTFDGNGYTISNLAIQGHGLFYNVFGGTIKNVSFENATIINYNTRNALFAHAFTKGIIENVYIHTTNGGSNRATIADYMEFTNVKIKNVVLNSTATGTDALEPLSRTYYAKDITTAFTNVYIINTKTVRSDYDGINRRADKYALAGVKRYDSIADWKGNVAYADIEALQNDYSTFIASGYWQVIDGIVAWKQ